MLLVDSEVEVCAALTWHEGENEAGSASVNSHKHMCMFWLNKDFIFKPEYIFTAKSLHLWRIIHYLIFQDSKYILIYNHVNSKYVKIKTPQK